MTKAEAACILNNLAWLGTRDEQDKVEAAIRIAVEELRSDAIEEQIMARLERCEEDLTLLFARCRIPRPQRD